MADRIFCFDPLKYKDHFDKHGYVHIKQGVTQEFYDKLVVQVDENMRTKKMKEFAIGDKQQAMYDFPPGGDYINEVKQALSVVVGLPAENIVMSERHIKAYDAGADPNPKAHKDRYASEISLGLSVHVKEGSTLVLYPYDENDINPFNASQHLRASFSNETAPEGALAKAKRIEINDAPRDVIMFRGHSIWHLRANPALTTMLYLKLNALNTDPLGEDSLTPMFKERTTKLVESGDGELAKLVPLIGRRVDFFHKHYDRHWQEVPGVVLFNEKHFTVDDEEWRLLRAVDGKRNVADAIRTAEMTGTNGITPLSKVRRLARRGVLDLISSV
jgi:hypothetical protein